MFSTREAFKIAYRATRQRGTTYASFDPHFMNGLLSWGHSQEKLGEQVLAAARKCREWTPEVAYQGRRRKLNGAGPVGRLP